MYTSKSPLRLLIIFTVVFPFTLFAQAVLIDDHTDRTNANEFDGYWYYYDDSRCIYENDRGYIAPTSLPSEIDVEYKIYPSRNSDDFSRDMPLNRRIYTFTLDEENGNAFATMPFTFGEAWETPDGVANSYVGMGTMLASEGTSFNLFDATAISFKIRSRKYKCTLFFKVLTLDILRDSSECYYHYELTTDTLWKEYKINFSDLTQPKTTKQSDVRDFNTSQVTTIVWEVVDAHSTGVSDTIDLDDIMIHDYFPLRIDPPYIIRHEPPATGLFSSFESAPRELTPLGTSWYAFTDNVYSGSSEIFDGAVAVDSSKYYVLNWVEGTGGQYIGFGPYIILTLGGDIRLENSLGDVATGKGYAGIECRLYDSAAASYLDVTKGITGRSGPNGTCRSIYFEYLADGDFNSMSLELLDINDVPDKDNPARRFTRGPGNVWHRDFPMNYQKWTGVEITFDSLVLDRESDTGTATPLDITRLAKIRFCARGPEGQSGLIAIDNIYFPEARTAIIRGNTVHQWQSSDFSATVRDGFITCHLNGMVPRSGTMVEIIGINGRAVRKLSLPSSGMQRVPVSIAGLSPGEYVIRVSGASTTGERIDFRQGIAIVK